MTIDEPSAEALIPECVYDNDCRHTSRCTTECGAVLNAMKMAAEAGQAAARRRHALAFNAISRVLADADRFVPLSVRDAATRAALAAAGSEDGTVIETPDRTETGPTIATVQVGVVVTGDSAADTTDAFAWAESVASHGVGLTAVIDIDVHAPGHDEPVPVEIPLDQARVLYAHLGGLLEEHNTPTPTGQDPAGDGMRKAIARAIHRYDYEQGLSGNGVPSKHHRGEADAVLAVRDAEMERLRGERDAALGIADADSRQLAEVDERCDLAVARIAAVRALHSEWKRNPDDKHPGYCAHCEKDGNVVRWPCPTLRALDAAEPTP